MCAEDNLRVVLWELSILNCEMRSLIGLVFADSIKLAVGETPGVLLSLPSQRRDL